MQVHAIADMVETSGTEGIPGSTTIVIIIIEVVDF